MNASQKRLAELEGRLDQRTAQRDDDVAERDRLRAVETDLNGRMQKLTDEVSGMKVAHQKELDRLLEARRVVEDDLRTEQDAAVKKLEDITATHQRELDAARTRADVMLAGMHEMDDLIAGKLLSFFRLFLRNRPSALWFSLGVSRSRLTSYSLLARILA